MISYAIPTSQIYSSGVREFHMIEPDVDLSGLRSLDPQAITAIHNRFYPEVFRFARFRLGDEHSAEDVAGEVFVRLLEATYNGRGPDRNLRGWLMSTASHLVNDYYRKYYQRPVETITEDHEELLEDEAANPMIHVETREDNQWIRNALNKLTDEQQKVIAYRFGSGFSLEETAVLMGKNANAIKALQFRALEALRREIGDKIL